MERHFQKRFQYADFDFFFLSKAASAKKPFPCQKRLSANAVQVYVNWPMIWIDWCTSYFHFFFEFMIPHNYP